MPLIDQPDSPELIEHQNDFTGGIRYGPPPIHLKPNEYVSSVGAEVTAGGKFLKLHGQTPIGPAFKITPRPDPYGLFYMSAKENRDVFARLSSFLYVAKYGDNFDPYSWTRVASNISFVNAYYTAVQGLVANDTTYTSVSGTTQAGVSLDALFLTAAVSTSQTGPSYSRVAWVASSGYSAAHVHYTIQPRGLTWFQKRLWFIDESTLYWSMLDDGSSWDSLSSSVVISRPGDDINMAITAMREPTPRLLIWRRNSVWLLDIYWTTEGYNPTLSNALDYTKALLRPIVFNVGLAAPRAVVWVPGTTGGGDYLYLARDGIRSLARSTSDTQGGASLPITSPRAQFFIDRINWAYAYKSVAWFHRGLAYFAVPLDTATDPGTVICYDPALDIFYFHGISAGAFATIEYPGRPPELLYQATNFSFENYTSGSGVSFPVSQPHVYNLSTGISFYNGTAVNFILATRAFTGDIAAPAGSGVRYAKRWNYIECGFQPAATNATFVIDYKVSTDYDAGSGSFTSRLGYMAVPGNSALSRALVIKSLALHGVTASNIISFQISETGCYDTPGIEYIEVSSFPYNHTIPPR